MSNDSMPHYTETKERILANYTGIWFTALSTFPGVIYVDGFAGSGIDKDGKYGSPLIALEKAAWSWERHQNADFTLYFVEKTKKKFLDLKKNIEARYSYLRKNASNPQAFDNKVRYSIFHADFHSVLPNIVSQVSANHWPAFFFVDPYDCQIPMDSLVKIMENSKAEILLNFMVSGIVRNRKKYSLQKLKSIFGNNINPASLGTCSKDIVEQYSQKLKDRTEAYILRYEMRNSKNAPLYYLVFATHSGLGVGKMKSVLYKQSTDRFFFTNDFSKDKSKINLFELPAFEKALRLEFTNHTSFTRGEIEEKMVNTDIHLFCLEQVNAYLKSLEAQRVIEVDRQYEKSGVSINRKKGTFPSNLKIWFT